MSRNQKRSQTHSKQKENIGRNKPKQQFIWVENFVKNFSIEPINAFLKSKTKGMQDFFKNLKEKRNYKMLLGEFLKNSKAYVTKNKTSVILATSLCTICFIGYFGIVYESNASDAKGILQDNSQTVSISLSDGTEPPVENNTNEVLANYSQNLDGTIKDENLVASQASEQKVATKKVSADISTNNLVSLTAKETKNNKEYEPISESLKLGVNMYAIKVEGKEVAYLETKGQADSVIKMLKDNYKLEGGVEEKIILRENVEIVKVKRDIFDFDGYKTEEEVLEYIVKGTNEQKIHKVETGENFWVIADEYGLNVQDLIDANPTIDEKKLQIGAELSLIVEEPIINVVAITKVERVDEIAYGKDENIKTNDYYVGDYRVKQNGVPGKAEVVVEVYMENGKLIGEKVLETNVLKEPVNKVVYEGIKIAPPRIGTGTFQRPTSRGYVTSRFGPRWGSFHNGLDIGLSMRTTVYAADGGVVIWSGYKGSFGKLVIIDHGGNLKSYYAHNDKLLVGVGDRVFKGQEISLSGNTGRSTGPHLHFEVRKNNVPVNPTKYVNY